MTTRMLVQNDHIETSDKALALFQFLMIMMAEKSVCGIFGENAIEGTKYFLELSIPVWIHTKLRA